jgi:methylated-DNA-[protein]-cysteine S-methyltransferase
MFYTTLNFPKGRIFLAKSSKGLSFATFMKSHKDLAKMTEFFRKRHIPLVESKKEFLIEEKLFQMYFAGKETNFTALPVNFFTRTEFQRKVWQKTRKIPYGRKETYKSLALKLNHKGYRSIGQALSKNPLLIVVPCHRVIGSDGSLGGFSAGLELKKYLLDLERGKA